MPEIVELFKMILERNELCRASFNARARLRYWSKQRRHKDYVKRVEKEAAIVQATTKAVYSFTAKTLKRRRQLAKSLKTTQKKDCDNVIDWVKLNNDKLYAVTDMKKIVQDYEIDRILLGQ